MSCHHLLTSVRLPDLAMCLPARVDGDHHRLRQGIDSFVDFVGSGGTFAGAAAYFKEVSKGVAQCHVVEPAGAAVLAERHAGHTYSSSSHQLQGGGYSQDKLVFVDQALSCVDG
jgi:cysteine synthase